MIPTSRVRPLISRTPRVSPEIAPNCPQGHSRVPSVTVSRIHSRVGNESVTNAWSFQRARRKRSTSSRRSAAAEAVLERLLAELGLARREEVLVALALAHEVEVADPCGVRSRPQRRE